MELFSLPLFPSFPLRGTRGEEGWSRWTGAASKGCMEQQARGGGRCSPQRERMWGPECSPAVPPRALSGTTPPPQAPETPKRELEMLSPAGSPPPPP